MELDCYLLGADLASIAHNSAALESYGHGCLWSVESYDDPFLPLMVAAEHTTEMRLGTNIAVAFARTPMVVGQVAHQLQRLSKGRFSLGLGPQVRAHIERRFSMPWSQPAARMREFVLALRAIWEAWETGGALNFDGRFYRHTLMAPNFDPGPTGYGPPPVYLAAVGPRMTAVAGELADGLLCHPLTTPAYLTDVIHPSLENVRRERAARPAVVASVLAASGSSSGAVDASVAAIRRKIAFYASTAAYLPMLEVHGLGHLQPELNALARSGRWDEMAGRIDDGIVERFAVVGSPDEIGRAVRQRFAGLVDRVALYELDDVGRLRVDARFLAEPDSVRQLMIGFSG